MPAHITEAMPAHILNERLLARSLPRQYKTLVIDSFPALIDKLIVPIGL